MVLIGGLNRDKQQMQECFYFRPPAVVPNNPNASQESFICRPEKLESPQIIQTTYCVAKVNNLAVLTGGLGLSYILYMTAIAYKLHDNSS